MIRTHNPVESSACPERAVLEAFHCGKLPEPSVETIAAHLTICSYCSSALDELHRAPARDDSLLGRLRQCRQPAEAEDRTGCAELEAAARVIPFADEPAAAALFTDSDVRDSSVTATIRTGRTTSAAPAEVALPTVVGPYQVLAKIGEGGMGIVYKARQSSVNRLVALKTVLAGAHARTQARTRFRIEGEAIARLRHPHVVQIFDFGDHEGLLYYSMELLESGSLESRLKENTLPARAAAELVRTLAGAVEYAHQARVLHRDLKPANILFAADGTPKVADFGLAKLLDAEEGHTQSDVVLGTASYMAPEQADGRVADIGVPTDVYGLGAILYRALAGRPPFKADSAAETRRQVIHTPLVPPSQVRRGLDRVLEAICLRCLEKAPARRYASAAALADDLGRWLRGEPTAARPPRWPARLGRWARRYAVALALGAAVLAVVAVAYWRNPQRAVEQAQRALANGQPVTLVGPMGRPRWSRWRVGGAESSLGGADEGPLVISSGTSRSLLELLPDPGCDRYRIDVQVQHLSGDFSTRCGLFFGYQTLVSPQGEVPGYLTLTFNGIHSAADFVDRVKASETIPAKIRARLRAPDTNCATLNARCEAVGPLPAPQGWNLFVASGADFKPSGATHPQPWHTLTVTLTPALLRAEMDGCLVGERAAPQYSLQMAMQLDGLRRNPTGTVYVQPGLPPEIPKRGALGLFVSHGFAAFREVVVTPLPDEP
jgi:eukaryotic-like serine/threonine-protein kinase